jgi:hypothetical protein
MEWVLRLKDERWKVLCQKALGFGLVYPLHIRRERALRPQGCRSSGPNIEDRKNSCLSIVNHGRMRCVWCVTVVRVAPFMDYLGVGLSLRYDVVDLC